MVKNGIRNTFLFTVILALVMTYVVGVSTFAAETISTNKAAYLAGEEMVVQVAGLTADQIANQEISVCTYKKGAEDRNSLTVNYMTDFDNGKWTTNAPTDLGSYDIRLFVRVDSKDTLLSQSSFVVESRKANAGDVTLSKTTLKVREEATLLVKGLAESQVKDGAWIALYKKGAASDKSSDIKYVYDLSVEADGSYKYVFEAPQDFGDYELRVFTKNVSDVKAMDQVLYATVGFKVGSSVAKDGDLKLSKTSCLALDQLTLTFKSDALTSEQIDDGAWFGIYKSSDAIDVRPQEVYYVADIRAKNLIAELQAPTELGDYEVRVFSKNTSFDKDELIATKFATLSFKVVSIKSNDKNDIKIKNNVMTDSQKFMMRETIKVVIKCHPTQAASEAAIKAGKSGGISPGQIVAGAWVGLFKLGDKNFATPVESVSLNDAATIRQTTADGSKIWEFEAPIIPGEYIIKVFTQNVEATKRDPVFFAEMPLTVVNGTKVNKGEGAFDWTNYTLGVAPTAVNVKVKKTVTLNVTAMPKAGSGASPLEVNNLVNFAVKDGKIAKVAVNAQGKAVITGLKKGTTKLTLTVKGTKSLTKTLNITVK